MKNIKHLSFILIAFLTIAICSCNNGTTATFTGGKQKPLTISITSNENIKLFDTSNNAQRTIVADAFTTGSGLTFYLWGTAQSGQELAPKEVTVTPSDAYNGKVILDIDSYNWDLTLAACPTAGLEDETNAEAAILADAVLIGYGNVNMMFTNNIKFTLSPKGLSKTGKVALTLNLGTGMSIPDGYTGKAFIYDVVSGQPVLSHSDEDLFQAYFDSTNATDDTAETRTAFASGASFNANNKEIDPGTYSFQVEFTKTGELRKYVWNDTLVILPGTTVTKTITIPNLIGTKPAKPEDFTVAFNDDEDADYEDLYSVHFTWDQDSVVNETNFVLQIAELKGDDAIAAITDSAGFDAIWDDATKYNAKETFDYLNDIKRDLKFYKSGSLFANSESLDVYLELGKRYIARLYSENNAGYSDEASYVTITSPTNVAAETGTLTTINRFRVRYYNQGGYWNVGGTKAEDQDSLMKIYYWSQTSNSKTYAVLNPVSSGTHATTGDKIGSASAPYLYRGPADWIYWVTNLSTGNKYPTDNGTSYTPDAYAGYENLDLYAIYSREGDVVIYNDIDYDIDDSTKDYVAGFGKTAAELSSLTTTTISKSGLGYNKDTAPDATTTVTVTLPTGDSLPVWVYDKVSFKMTYSDVVFFTETQVGEARGTANTFTITLKNLPTGYIYNCLVKAQYNKTTVSYPFTIYLTD